MTGLRGAYCKLVDNFKDFVMQYIVDSFLKRLGTPLKIIAVVDFVMNLSAYTVVELILNKYGLGYLVKYAFLISLL